MEPQCLHEKKKLRRQKHISITSEQNTLPETHVIEKVEAKMK